MHCAQVLGLSLFLLIVFGGIPICWAIALRIEDVGHVSSPAAQEAIAQEVDRVKQECLAAVLQIVDKQPFYPDTHTGMRQKWVKEEIARKVRGLGAACDG